MRNKLIRYKDYEENKVAVPNEFYEPVYRFHPLTGWYLEKFVGNRSGTELHPEWVDAIENGDICNENIMRKT